MIHEFTFEHMMSLYSPYLYDKYHDTWGLNEEFKNEREEYQKGGLCFLKQHFGEWVGKLLYDKCLEAGFPGLEKINTEIEHYEEKYTCPMEDSTIAPFQLDGWYGDYYIIKLDGKDETGKFLTLLGQILHDYGVNSEKHLERGLVCEKQRDFMFRAMVVENTLGELYSIVEKAYKN